MYVAGHSSRVLLEGLDILRHVLIQCLFVSGGILVWGLGARAEVIIETVTVGNPGNADDTHGDGYGGVGYVYNIGKFEVTAGQYTEFLNAVADEDTYGLHNPDMWGHPYGCGIEQTGSSGSYTYSVAADWADRPVNWVSWGDAARFANWLHNGQPTGAQGLGTTEDGSYFLDGAISSTDLLAITRESDPTWVIPSEDEWYKAAYHYNDGVTGNYFDYPTSGDNMPSNDLVESTDPGDNATFNDCTCDGGFTIGSPYWRTERGAHENSDSPYGTFDQGGNVLEWNDGITHGSYRGLRGGSFMFDGVGMHVRFRFGHDATNESYYFGFRVAEVAEPNCTHDGDGDGDVDLYDFAVYQATFADARCYALFHMAFNGPR